MWVPQAVPLGLTGMPEMANIDKIWDDSSDFDSDGAAVSKRRAKTSSKNMGKKRQQLMKTVRPVNRLPWPVAKPMKSTKKKKGNSKAKKSSGT